MHVKHLLEEFETMLHSPYLFDLTTFNLHTSSIWIGRHIFKSKSWELQKNITQVLQTSTLTNTQEYIYAVGTLISETNVSQPERVSNTQKSHVLGIL